MIKSTKSNHSSTVNMLIYGESGVGKTYLATTCDRPLVISAEGGVLSLAAHDIPYIDVTDLKSARDAVKYVTEHAHEYGTVIFDSLSEVAEIILADALAKTPDPRKAYPDSEAAVTRLIRQLRSLPCNVVWIAKRGTDKDNNGVTVYAPSAPGSKFAGKLPYLFDLVGYMTIQSVTGADGNTTTRRVILTESDGTYVAKDRSGALPAVCPPHIGKIVAKATRQTAA